jgi:isocitrate dehydrogenase kinase/phosphatase
MKSSSEVKEAATLAERNRIIHILFERRMNVADLYLQTNNSQVKEEILSIYHEINDLITIIRGNNK